MTILPKVVKKCLKNNVFSKFKTHKKIFYKITLKNCCLVFSVSVFFTTKFVIYSKIKTNFNILYLKKPKGLKFYKINSFFIPKAWYYLYVIFCSLYILLCNKILEHV